jgi:hypothetical protein
MIKVLYPPGCYGTYVARCLYNWTSLRSEPYEPFTFDSTGSSHVYRESSAARQAVICGHLDNLRMDFQDVLVTIMPESEHRLDYYDNQFHKQNQKHLVDFITSQLSQDEIHHKLKHQWNYDKKFDETCPRWILREFFSFWIADCLEQGYSQKHYASVPSAFSFTTKDIFLNFLNTFNHMCDALKLQIDLDASQMQLDHTKFLNNQIYHNQQNRCDQWIQSCLLGEDGVSPCQTIFDEAYVQNQLRIQGYEIMCDQLDLFPTCSGKLKNLLYAI